jgi:uncharacterized protein (DUF1330 family)
MPAYLIGQIRVKDQKKWQEYVAGVAESLIPFDSEIVFRGRKIGVFAGEHDKDLTVVIRFVDQDTMQKWFDSDFYQGLIPLRDEAANVTIIGYDAI